MTPTKCPNASGLTQSAESVSALDLETAPHAPRTRAGSICGPQKPSSPRGKGVATQTENSTGCQGNTQLEEIANFIKPTTNEGIPTKNVAAVEITDPSSTEGTFSNEASCRFESRQTSSSINLTPRENYPIR
ncbi:hypothetical protein JCM33374_g4715 [Metschnikowia sp. JCM 33374]|nr:hypothetical protein JCM33374_g4715 [Metschnikowia sp. JCM 33374]